MEIDFLIRRDNKLIPIEVKSSKAYSLSSLKQFKKCFSSKVGLQYVLYDGDIKREEEIIYLPYYMASVLWSYNIKKTALEGCKIYAVASCSRHSNEENEITLI